MPFCDVMNAFMDMWQLVYDLVMGVFGWPAPSIADSIGSVLGCNIV